LLQEPRLSAANLPASPFLLAQFPRPKLNLVGAADSCFWSSITGLLHIHIQYTYLCSLVYSISLFAGKQVFLKIVLVLDANIEDVADEDSAKMAQDMAEALEVRISRHDIVFVVLLVIIRHSLNVNCALLRCLPH
jgi:hypothetical protein